MNTDELPPLPIAAVDEHNLQGGRLLYSRDQMRAYARAAVLAERERNAEIVLQELGDTGQAKAIAAAIRAETKSPE